LGTVGAGLLAGLCSSCETTIPSSGLYSAAAAGANTPALRAHYERLSWQAHQRERDEQGQKVIIIYKEKTPEVDYPGKGRGRRMTEEEKQEFMKMWKRSIKERNKNR